jgi:hypothetical protein
MKMKHTALKTLIVGATLPAFAQVGDNFIISDTSIVKNISNVNARYIRTQPNMIIISHINLIKLLNSGKLPEHIVNKIEEKITELSFQ